MRCSYGVPHRHGGVEDADDDEWNPQRTLRYRHAVPAREDGHVWRRGRGEDADGPA